MTITQFRRDLFRLVERALAGKPLEFVHRGVVFKVTQLAGQPAVAPGTDLEEASRELLKEMQSEWEKDCAEL